MIGKWREINAGDVYGSLTVIEEAIPHLSADGKKKRFFKCKCVCGREVEVSMPALTRNVRTTCGCGRYCKHSVRKPIEYNGEARYAPEWAEILGISVNTIYTRMYRGDLTPEEILGFKKIEYKTAPKHIIQIDKKTGDVVAEYSSATEAAKATGFNYYCICACLRGDSKSSRGFIWEKAK